MENGQISIIFDKTETEIQFTEKKNNIDRFQTSTLMERNMDSGGNLSEQLHPN